MARKPEHHGWNTINGRLKTGHSGALTIDAIQNQSQSLHGNYQIKKGEQMRKRKILKGIYWMLGYCFGVLLEAERTWGWLIVAGITLVVMLIDTEE